ncbi:MAG: hypothetical protein ACTIA5_01580 [Brachybacterium tyrofermentans]
MKTTELTDIDGDALTITQRLDGTWITCTKGAEEVTIGPVPTDAVRHAFETPMGGDDMDGGVTAAAIEAEVVSPERARSLVQERDEARRRAETAERKAERAAREAERRGRVLAERTRERDDARGDCNDALRREKAEQDRAVQAEQERDEAEDSLTAYVAAQAFQGPAPLTPDMVDDAMRKRAAVVYEEVFRKIGPSAALDAALLAAFNPPTRPAGAEQLDPLVDRAIRGCSDIASPETARTIANGLAEQGVLAPGDQS